MIFWFFFRDQGGTNPVFHTGSETVVWKQSVCQSWEMGVSHLFRVLFRVYCGAEAVITRSCQGSCSHGWPSPTTRKQLQQFLGFANFYHCFIRNYSKVAAPPTAPPQPSGQEAKTAFFRLKVLFTTTPVLSHPGWHSTVTAGCDSPEAASLGVFWSSSLSSRAKLQCEKSGVAGSGVGTGWRGQQSHLLFGQTSKTYLQAKQLNYWQERWALFPGRFVFVLIYIQVPKTRRLMLCFASSPVTSLISIPSRFFCRPA